MEHEKLIKYLSTVRDLEGIIYTHKEALKKLNQEYHNASQRINGNNYEQLYSHTNSASDVPPHTAKQCIQKGIATGITFAAAFFVPAVIFGAIFATVSHGFFDVTGDHIASGITSMVILDFIISAIIGIRSGKSLYNQFEYGSPKWREIEQANYEIKKRNEIARKNDERLMKLIPQEIELLKKNLNSACNLLEQYYNVGILHKDYQNIIAVCSIYQYLDSGRCFELTGKDGAYNLYEDEKYRNIIIAKLDVIIQKLNQIQQTQRELYRVIKNCESKIDSLVSITSRMTTVLDSIQQSSEITAYNTTYLKQMEEYKFLVYKY